MIPCPSSRYRVPPYRQRAPDTEDVVYDDDRAAEANAGTTNEESEDKGEYDYPENQNRGENEEYDEETPRPPSQSAHDEFEQLSNRVKCKGGKCDRHHHADHNDDVVDVDDGDDDNSNNEYENVEQENQEQEYENDEEEENQEESPDSKEEDRKPSAKPKPKPKPKPPPKPTPKPKGIDPKLNALTVIHNYQKAKFPIVTKKPNNLQASSEEEDKSKEDIGEDEEEEDSQESRLEDVEEYNEGDDLQDDEYYYDDDEEEYDQTPKKPKIPQKLTNIDNMKFNVEGDEPSESIYKNTVLKNVSKGDDLIKPHVSETTQVNLTTTQLNQHRPRPYDSAAEAYTRIKDKKKPHDQQIMQMTVHETTVSFNLVDERNNNKNKLHTKTDSTTTTTVTTKYRPRPPTVTVRPNVSKRWDFYRDLTLEHFRRSLLKKKIYINISPRVSK